MRCVTCGEPNPNALDPCPTCGAGAAAPAPRSAEELEAAFATDDGPQGPTAGPLRIGQDFGTRYTILKLLGVGGMGVVYQALDRDLGVPVALKVLRPSDGNPRAVAELYRRLKAELLLARRVTHKHVIRIHDIGDIDGIRFITMPFVNGRDLATVLKTGHLPVVRALRYARQLASGLAAAHAAGVIHRDLKPANIMIDEDDNALLMDFGIARSSAPDAPQRTIAGAVLGTAAYMAPEQARGETVDARADIYAFGLILYEMLAGPRFMPQGAVADLYSRLTAAPAPARAANGDVPLALDAIVTRCVQPGPEARYQSSDELVAALAGLSRRGHGPVPGAPQAPGRSWIAKAAAVLVLLMLGGGAYWYIGRTNLAAVASARSTGGSADEADDERRAREGADEVPYVGTVDFQRVLELAQRPVERSPALRKQQDDRVRAFLPMASAASATSLDAARDVYLQMAAVGPQGASLAMTGLADLEMLRGHHAAAAEMLERAIEMDRRARNLATTAPKYLALAEARLGEGRPVDAATAVRQAINTSRDQNVLMPAARLFIELDRPAEARAIATELAASPDRNGVAYSHLLEAELALDRGEAQQAIKTLESAITADDLWLLRMVLGTAYVQAERYDDAFAEFDTCRIRRSEAASVLGDETPTLRYLAALDAWIARARREAALASPRN
jgi:tetratricopeptide (TPR) repeat protein